jgi:excisionase family DNA binding protein
MQLLTPKQVAARLSVSPRTVYAWIAEGRLVTVRLSERVTRVPEEAVDALVREALTPAGAHIFASEPSTAYGTSSVDATDALTVRIQAVRTEILAAAAADLVANVRLFGSVARGDARAESDLDLLVDPLPGCTIFNLTGFRITMEGLLGVSVDVVPARSLKADIAKGVLAEAKPL